MLELSRSGSFCHFNSPAITGRLRVHADTTKILKKIWNRLAVTNFTILNLEPEIYGILGICFYNSEAAPSGRGSRRRYSPGSASFLTLVRFSYLDINEQVDQDRDTAGNEIEIAVDDGIWGALDTGRNPTGTLESDGPVQTQHALAQ